MWDPHSESFQLQEENTSYHYDHYDNYKAPDRNIDSMSQLQTQILRCITMVSISESLDDSRLFKIAGRQSWHRELTFAVEKLGQNWNNISLLLSFDFYEPVLY